MKCAVLMDPIENINPVKDTSFAILLAAQQRDYDNYIIEPHAIWLQDGLVWAKMRPVTVSDDVLNWFECGDTVTQPLVELDCLFMRKDPPFDINYIYLTYLLEQAEAKGLLVVNRPSSLRDANEKLYTAWFPQCCPKTLVTSDAELIRDFIGHHHKAVIKPLGGMGGHSVFCATEQDSNLSTIIEIMTNNGSELTMVQQFIPEIVSGDKRILLIDGLPAPYALARVPAEGEFRGNLAAGAHAEGRELTARDHWICEQVGPVLRDKGLFFVGLDVIGDYLTEINVTSPTGVRQLDRIFDICICDDLLDVVEDKVVLSK
jgi:glutathione synthase